MDVIQTHHVSSHVHQDVKGKETEVTKKVVFNVRGYLEEFSRYKQTQGSLKQTSDAAGLS